MELTDMERMLINIQQQRVLALEAALPYLFPQWMEEFYGVEILATHSTKYKDLFDFVRKAGYFPNNAARGCTSRLKQRPFGEWLQNNGFTTSGRCIIYLGMRADESRTRIEKYSGIRATDKFTLSDISSEYPANIFGSVQVRLPLVNWTTEQVFAALAARGALVNPLYGKGHKRVGCYPCLLANNLEWQLAASDDIGRKHIKRLLQIQRRFEKEGNPRKFIKVHPTRDIESLLQNKKIKETDTDDVGCKMCTI